jgi:uncharacterized membrane protein
MSFGRLIDLMSALVALMALVSAGATLAATHRLMMALAVLLDLLTAAGLLRLAVDPDLMRAATAAIVLAIRNVVSWSLSKDVRSGQG